MTRSILLRQNLLHRPVKPCSFAAFSSRTYSVVTGSRPPMITEFTHQLLTTTQVHVKRNEDALFQVGSFFEAYFEPAKRLSTLLGLKLTSRPMRVRPNEPSTEQFLCGFPLAQLGKHVQTLVQRERLCIAVYEEYQMDLVDKLKDRRLTRIFTPGTLCEPEYTNAESNNFLAAVNVPFFQSRTVFLAWTDLSIGEYVEKKIDIQDLANELAILQPSEILVSEDVQLGLPLQTMLENIACQSSRASSFIITRVPKCNSGSSVRAMLESYVARCFPLEKITLGTSPSDPSTKLPVLMLNAAVLNSLEVITDTNGRRKDSLLGVVKNTRTSGGSRLLAARLSTPSQSLSVINDRLNRVEAFYSEPTLRMEVATILGKIPDAERILFRLQKKPLFQDVFLLQVTLSCARDLCETISQYTANMRLAPECMLVQIASELANKLKEISPLVGAIKACNEENMNNTFEIPINPGNSDSASEEDMTRESDYAPPTWNIKPSFSVALQMAHNQLLARLDEKRVLQRDLRLKHSGKLALEFDKRNKAPTIRCPATALRISEIGPVIRSTKVQKIVANNAWNILALQIDACERRIEELEETELYRLANWIQKDLSSVKGVLEYIHDLDVCIGFAETANEQHFTRPCLDNSRDIEIFDGRHPIVSYQSFNFRAGYQPTSVELKAPSKFMIITGPNMGGKSTNLRQVALITLLAQAGSFVPAKFARIGLVDRIFTRIGAHDNLSAGHSTFMIEMRELADILASASDKSLVLLDEIGRGTAPEDGLAISYASAAHLMDTSCRTILATHFHRVCDLLIENGRANALSLKHTSLMNGATTGRAEFDYSLKDGVNRSSEGIATAKLAGLPDTVIVEAQKILRTLHIQNESYKGI